MEVFIAERSEGVDTFVRYCEDVFSTLQKGMAHYTQEHNWNMWPDGAGASTVRKHGVQLTIRRM